MGPKRRLSENNKEYCKCYRKKNSKKYKENDALRKRHTRMLTETFNPLLHEELKNKNQERMRLSREKKHEEKEDVKVMKQETSAFSNKQSRARSLKRAEEGLPISPGKKMEVIGKEI